MFEIIPAYNEKAVRTTYVMKKNTYVMWKNTYGMEKNTHVIRKIPM
jgi:hypothetical protein